MEGTVPIGTLLGALFWLFVIPILLIFGARKYRRHLLGGDKKKQSVDKLEGDLLKEIKDSYGKLSEDQKRKVDNIK